MVQYKNYGPDPNEERNINVSSQNILEDITEEYRRAKYVVN